MKRTIIKIALCAGVLFSVTSCREDHLDNNPPGILDETNAVETVEDLGKLMNSAYSRVNSRTESVDVSVLTDEVGIGYDNGGQGLSGSYTFQVLPTRSALASTVWTSGYISLSRVNRVLKFAEKIATTTTDAAEINKLNIIKAEALTMRAYIHLRILGYFTEDMTDDSALAGVLANKTFTLNEANTNVRSTNGEFYTFIHDDLDAALSLYDGVAGYTMNNKRANKIFAMGLKARAYSYKGDYTNAGTWAEKVITNSGLQLSPLADYVKTFMGDNEAASEVIFKLRRTPSQNSQGSNLHNGWASSTPSKSGSPFYEIGRALFNKLSDMDVRKLVIVSPTSVIDPNYATSTDYLNSDILVINKHGGYVTQLGDTKPYAVTTDNGFNNDIKVMRLSEMYYIKAESQAASDPSGAGTTIDIVRKARSLATTITPSNFTTPQDAWAGILADKRIEFAYEGYRFLDLKRLRQKANVGIDRDPADYAAYSAANPSNFASHIWALPIPQAELNANSVIKQNPGY